ncbi:MAG: putative bifunctional diguanylate cyclase/phosphodiesterase [Acidimicrobiales bacterium]
MAAAIVLGSIAYVLYLALAPGSARSVTVVNDVIQTIIPLIVAAALASAGRASTGRQRTSWFLFAGAALSWGIGQAIWTWYEVVQDQEVPYPSLADLGYLGAVPLLLAGVLLFPSRSLRTVGRVRAVIDGLMTLFTIAFVSYGTFLGVVYMTSEGDALDRVLAVIYPASDVVVVAVVLAVLARRVDRLGGPLPLIATGVVSLAIADSAFAYMTAKGTYGDDPVTDIGWPLGFALLALASSMPGEATAEAGTRRLTSSLLGVSLPYLPLIPGIAVFVSKAFSGETMDPFLAATSSAAAVMLVLRQVLTMLENRELTGSLEMTVAELREREGQLQFQAFHDPLTLLANRALFRDRLDHALEQRREDPVSVLFVDLDDFKTVNDSLGHDVGDHLLVSVAERLRACVRVGDTVARIGGDEFAILVEGDTTGTEGPVIAQRVLAGLAVPFSVAGRDLRVSASLGLASGRYDTGEDVLRDADLAMYAAKANGKARVELFEHAMRTSAVDRLELVADVHAAVDAGEMRVHLQPVVDLRTLEVEGHEALVRWEHPQRGLLAPAAFMALAEETGAIVPMGWWVLEQACEKAMAWPHGHVGVNMAARQLLDPGAVTTVASILARTGIEPSRVVLEITESVFLDTEAIGHRLHQLRALGVRLAIDDFGTGYSSLSYLTRLPVDIVKIDRSFIDRLGGPPGDEVLVRAVVQLARSLGLRSVGEGVETPAQLERLQSFGCDAAQGYLFGAPADDPKFDLGGLRPLHVEPARREA